MVLLLLLWRVAFECSRESDRKKKLKVREAPEDHRLDSGLLADHALQVPGL